MPKPEFRRIVTAFMIATLLVASLSTLASAAMNSAQLAQGLRAQEVQGVIPGGQFAKIWLGLEAQTLGENITVVSEWDRLDPGLNGLGFYILDEGGLARVLNGSADVRDANLSAGSKLSPEMPANQLGAQFRATGGNYTIVVFNDSNADANFTLRATNGVITDDSDQVTDPNAATSTPEAAEGEADAVEDDVSAETPEAETPEAEATTTPEPVATATEAVTTTEQVVVTTEPGVVSGQVMSGELPNQNDQHFLKLEPSIKDGNVILLLSFDPQDSSELARRMNFWVLDQDGFSRFVDPNDNANLAEIAFAAGSSDPQIASNERKASFTASGFGPYTVIVYNNSRVPGTYRLQVDGGLLTDDSGQTLTAQEVGTTTVVTGTATTEGGTETATEPDAAATPAPAGREGEPGGTYTIQSGDTLSLVAQDVYDDLSLWDEICAFNGLEDCNKVEVGDELKLPTLEEIGSGATAAPATTPAPAATATPVAAATPASSTSVTTTTTVTSTEAMTSTDEVTETTTTTSTAEVSETAVDLVASMEASGNFSTLVEALTAAGLVDALKGNGPFTIHAPTDAAFAALPAGAMDQLLANPTGQLTQILLFHVLPGKVMSSDISNGMQATTQQGKPVTYEVDGDEIKVNGAIVIVPDLEASNGVIHAIDAVILPPPD